MLKTRAESGTEGEEEAEHLRRHVSVDQHAAQMNGGRERETDRRSVGRLSLLSAQATAELDPSICLEPEHI